MVECLRARVRLLSRITSRSPRLSEIQAEISAMNQEEEAAGIWRDEKIAALTAALQAWCALGKLVYPPEVFTGISGDTGAVAVAAAWKATKDAGFDASAGEHLIAELEKMIKRIEELEEAHGKGERGGA